MGMEFSQGDEYGLKLDIGGGCTTLNVLNAIESFKRVNFRYCISHFKKIK